MHAARSGPAPVPARVVEGAGAGLFVIQNPAAGTRKAERSRQRIAALLRERGVSHCFAYTQGPGHAETLAREALARGWDRIAVAGGDGTVLDVASALAGTEAALALLPVGTGNQLAANLGVPRQIGRAVDVAVGGRVRTIDVGVIADRPFTIMAGAGFDAEVVRPDWRIKRRIGYLAYVYAAARAAFAPRRSSLRVIVDGREMRGRGIGVEVVNVPGLSGPGLRRPVHVVPHARVDDGRLDVCLLALERRSDVVRALLSIAAGHPERDPGLRYEQGREIQVDADPPLPVQADGEQLGVTPFQARVWPSALNVIVPNRSGAPERGRPAGPGDHAERSTS